MAVLTARAREFLFALEIGDTHEISRQFRLCGERSGLGSWGRGPVLYGSVKEWVCPSRKSERKAKNFGFLLEEDGQGGRGRPGGAEGGYVFIGDTGEGDPRAGEIMSSSHPDRMRAVFLHVVSDSPRQGSVSVPADRVVSGVPVVYFRTYVGAAAKAVGLGLMDEKGLRNVIAAAKEVRRRSRLKNKARLIIPSIRFLSIEPAPCSKWAWITIGAQRVVSSHRCGSTRMKNSIP